MVEVRVSFLSPLASEIFSPGDLLDKLDTTTEFLLFHAGGMEGFCKDTEDVVTLKIPHHLVTLPRPYMTTFHYQLEIHYPLLPLFLQAILIEKD